MNAIIQNQNQAVRCQKTEQCGGSKILSMTCRLMVMVACMALIFSSHAGPVAVGHPGGNYIKPPPVLPMQFAVISDLHLYWQRLGVSGAAFENYVDNDPKLLRESEAILESAIDSIIQQGVRFVIIPGDLTKDGEIANHVLVAKFLAKLEHHGIQVYVVPGNHDINNPDAMSFKGDIPRAVPTASPKVFRAIYQRFGYGQAIDRDRHSLSYVAEPVNGLWLLAIDSTDTAHNQDLGHPRVGGKLSPETLDWIVTKLDQAKQKGKRVIAFMHHGVNPDFAAQPVLFPDFLVDDWPTVNLTLANAGLRVIFTGHYHAQDASYLCDENGAVISPLCDIETSSLVVYPCAYRIVTVQPDNTLNIESRRVTDVHADTGGLAFQDYAYVQLASRLPNLAIAQLENGFGVPEAQAQALAPFVTDAILAGYVGDEQPGAQTQTVLNSFVNSPDPLHTLGLLLYGMWTDPPPADNNLVVPLAD